MDKQKIKALFTKNISWKLLSLFLGVVVWIGTISIYNPTIVRPIRSVPLKLDNLKVLEKNNRLISDADMQSLKNVSVTVDVRGGKMTVDSINADNMIEAFVDFSLLENYAAADNVPFKIGVQVRPKNSANSDNFSIIDWSPRYVEVSLDTKGTVDLEVNLVASGTAADSYKAKVEKATISPETVKVTGPLSIINNMKVNANVNLNNISSEVIKEIELDYSSKINGAKIEDTSMFSVSTEKVKVRIPVFKEKKIRIDKPKVKVIEQLSGYTIRDDKITISIDSVTIIGSESEVAKIDRIPLPDIEIDASATTDVERTFDLQQIIVDSDDIPRVDLDLTAEERQVTVVVPIEKNVYKTITMPFDLKGIPANLKTQVQEAVVKIDVVGPASILDNLQSIKDCTADLTGLGIGTHSVPVSFTLPNFVKLSSSAESNPPMVTVVIEEPLAEEATEDPNVDNTDGTEEPSENASENPTETEQPSEQTNNDSDNSYG